MNFMTSERQSPGNALATPTARYVQEMADAHGIAYQPTSGDELAHHITRLAGDEIDTDETEDLLLTLSRAGKITGKEMVRLVVQHLREKKELGAQGVRSVPGL